MKRWDIEYIHGYSAPGDSCEDYHLFTAKVPEAEFDLDEAVKLCTNWAETHGCDGMKIRRKYIIGRFEDRTLYAVITVPCYRLKGELLEAEEYFRIVHGWEAKATEVPV